MKTAATPMDIRPGGGGGGGEQNQQVLPECRTAGGRKHLVRPEYAQKRTVQEGTRQERRDDRRGLAMSVRQPGMQWSQTHFCPVTDEQKHEGELEPRRIEVDPPLDKIVGQQ